MAHNPQLKRQRFIDYGEPADREAERLLRDIIAPGTSGDPNDPMDDFPLIRDSGDIPECLRRDPDAACWKHEANNNRQAPIGDEPPAMSPDEYGANVKPASNRNLPVAFPLLAFENIQLDTERRSYLVKGLLASAGLAVIWGPPKCYKSFWTFDLALHIAFGWEYRGHKVQQTTVVYVALEGRSGFPARIEAFRRHHGVTAAQFYLITSALDLSKQADALIASIEAQLGPTRPGAIFIDTLNRSLVGSESKDEDMARYLAGAGKIEERFGCLVAIVHHCGIDTSRPRGHTSLSAAVESQIKVERPATGEVIVTVELAKDFSEGTEIASRLDQIEVGIDPDGDPITSLVVVPADPSRVAIRKKGRGRTKSQKAIIAAIDEALDYRGKVIVPRSGMPEVRAVKVSDVRPEFDRRYVVTETDPAKIENAKRMAFGRAIDNLPEEFSAGEIEGADWIWKIT